MARECEAMTDCLKGKAHEWRLMTAGGKDVVPVVACKQCGETGSLGDLDADIGQFYAMRDERDKLQAELEFNEMDHFECVSCGVVNNRIRGAKRYRNSQDEVDALQAELEALKLRSTKDARDFHEIQDLLVKQRNAARAWAIRMKQDRDWLTEKLEFAREEAEDDCEALDKLETENELLKAELKARDERRDCLTCDWWGKRYAKHGCAGLTAINAMKCRKEGHVHWEAKP